MARFTPATFGEWSYYKALYFQHLKAANGLLFHAYDEDGSAPWAKSNGGLGAFLIMNEQLRAQ